MRGQRWDNCDADIRAFIERVVLSFRQYLDESLVGVYLHGSLAMGCYRRAKSDIDLLIVVRRHLSEPTRRRLALTIADLSDARPTIGDLELSLIQEQHAQNFVHPLPYELHYSETWKEKIRNGEVDFAEERRDRDLAAHGTVVRARGVCLMGLPIAEVFGPVPWEDFLDAVLDDFEWLVKDDNILESPFYCVLNCCRVLQVLTGGEGTIVNKEEGGWWGLAHLPETQRPVIRQALECYQSAQKVRPEQRKTGGIVWDADVLRSFRDFAAQEAMSLKEQARIKTLAPPAKLG